MARNITIKDHELKEILGGHKTNATQYISDCPFCGKEGHFYINKRTQLFDCKRCGEDGNIIKLLKHTGKLFLIGNFKSINRSKISSLNPIKEEEQEEVCLTPPKRKLPIGFKRIYSCKYWEDRGFTKKDFKKYKIGETSLLSSFKNYSIISVEEDGNCVGFISRAKLSKQEIKKIEEKTGRKILRYRNDKGAKFSQLLLGIDEINENTETVILLEGFPNKVALDRILDLDSQDYIKCCVTFGKKISLSQVLKLLSKGVKNIILVFDFDAVSEMKKYGSMLSEFFDSVLIGFTFGKDIDESTDEEVLSLFDNLKSPSEFKRGVVKYL